MVCGIIKNIVEDIILWMTKGRRGGGEVKKKKGRGRGSPVARVLMIQ